MTTDKRVVVKKRENGDWVVDLGRKWFSVRKDGTVLAKRVSRRRRDGSISAFTVRPATKNEIVFAKAAIAERKAQLRLVT